MLRFVLVFTVTLIAASLLLHGTLLDGSHPCIAVADTSLEVSDLPWHADLHVAFTDDPAAATVRVGLSDGPEGADFAVVDDADDAEPTACEVNPQTRFVTVCQPRLLGVPSSISQATGRPTSVSSSGRTGFRCAMRLLSSSARAADTSARNRQRCSSHSILLQGQPVFISLQTAMGLTLYQPRSHPKA
jgi:hypothetical protein